MPDKQPADPKVDPRALLCSICKKPIGSGQPGDSPCRKLTKGLYAHEECLRKQATDGVSKAT